MSEGHQKTLGKRASSHINKSQNLALVVQSQEKYTEAEEMN